MTTKVEEQDGKFVVTFNGELDTAAAAETEASWILLPQQRRKRPWRL